MGRFALSRSGWRNLICSGYICILFTLLAQPAKASFHHNSPLVRVHQPRTSRLEILPRWQPLESTRRRSTPVYRRAADTPEENDLGFEDWWRTTVDLEDGTELYIHLKPSRNLIHPQASMLTTDPLTNTPVSTPLDRTSILAFSGSVYSDRRTSDRKWAEDRTRSFSSFGHDKDYPTDPESSGWARFLVRPITNSDQSALGRVFEGAFTHNGGIHNVLSRETYNLHRRNGDVQLLDHDQGRADASQMVIFKDSGYEQSISEVPSSGCMHDKLDFNTNNTHPVYTAPRSSSLEENWDQNDPWWVKSSMDQKDSWRVRRDLDLDITGLGSLQARQDVPVSGTVDYSGTIGQTTGCVKEQRVVYTGVAADCAYVGAYGSVEEARQAILNNWNTASALYRQTFNISLGISTIFIPSNPLTDCPTSASSGSTEPWNLACSASTDLNSRLSLFSAWRGASERSGDDLGLWHLMSGCRTGSEVGVAWLGQVCVSSARNQGSSGVVSGTAVSTNGATEWQIVAHETGHNFGAIHDCASGCSLGQTTCCPLSVSQCNADGQYLMSPVSSRGETVFSPCSIGNICSVIGNKAIDLSCLKQPGSTDVISLQQCGNGILEPGEDCDPGSNATSACCDPATCKFRTGAVCDPTSAACCTETCQYASSSVVCRPAQGECDIQETCTGNSSSCPTDRTVDDRTSCGTSGQGLTCASGVCTSRDLQCKLAGMDYKLDRACSSLPVGTSSCSLTCQAPGSINTCVSLNSHFLDGTACGYSGTCQNGSCAGQSGLESAKGWYRDHLNIAIPVTVVVGLIVLAIIFSVARCICGCGSRKKKGRRAVLVTDTHPPMYPQTRPYAASGNIGFPPSAQQAPPPRWVDPEMYNGPNAYGGSGDSRQPYGVRH
ncbi:Meltrins, fertilins and related Zn-dependent metalloproteinases of the ADAMs family [Phaffia rhodozyma]|uniref:Disintegrin and metalloproteinase domain-containing protein B n=1 Tax=Phaffia rhodozyma TaxID=264483 RepID=A0A0F7SEA1_PHARH|nr:Meltrins, fertilins and related Zn-dependent metalloproteinases of the ADAMs family [Phaffia rhodozyma]